MRLIANLSSRINNNQQKYKHFLCYPASKVLIEIVKLLFKQSFIRGFFIEKNNNQGYIYLMLKYGSHTKIFQKISGILKFNCDKQLSRIIKYNNGLGLYIISTSKGFVTNYEAVKLNLGGNFIIKIY